MVTTKANCVTSGAVIWFCRKTAWTKLIICGLQMPKFTMIQSVMSLFCEFGLLTQYCTHCFMVNDANDPIVVVFLVYDWQRIHRQNKSNV